MKREWFRSFFDSAYLELLQAQWSPRETSRQIGFLRRVLRLRRGSAVLDVPCGYGRHASRLARAGCRVTAVDLSPAMVAEAKRRFGSLPGLQIQRGDIRRLRFRSEFDAVLCLFTSVGYFSPRQNEHAVRKLVRAAKIGGRILVDHRNLAWTRRHFVPKIWWRVGRFWIAEEASFDRARGVITSEWNVLDPARGRIARRRFRIQQYDLGQWRGMFARAGARLDGWATDFDGRRSMARERPRLIVWARRVR